MHTQLGPDANQHAFPIIRAVIPPILDHICHHPDSCMPWVWLQITALGLFAHPRAYLRSPWNQLDFVVVITSIVSTATPTNHLSILRALRLLRVLRPLRMISRFKVRVLPSEPSHNPFPPPSRPPRPFVSTPTFLLLPNVGRGGGCAEDSQGPGKEQLNKVAKGFWRWGWTSSISQNLHFILHKTYVYCITHLYILQGLIRVLIQLSLKVI